MPPIQNPKSRIQNRQGRVIVVGSSNTDLAVHCSKLPHPGETVLGGELQVFGGGKGANQAVAAARAGARVHFIGAFGDDAFGKARRSDLEREGIDCSGCVIKKGVPSGVALIAVEKGKGRRIAENQIVVAPGANARLTPADVRRGMPRDLCDRDVVVASLEIPMAAVSAAFEITQRASAQSILNPAPFPRRGLPRALLNMAVVVTPNEAEARALLKADISSERARRRMMRMCDEFCGHFIVTRGAKGAVYSYLYFPADLPEYDEHAKDARPDDPVILHHGDGGKPVILGPAVARLGCDRFSAPKVTPRDTVGAGDCFNGALAAFLAARQYEFNDAIRFAIAAASIKVTRRGAQPGMPRRAEILKMLKRMKK